jgi:hypothetical protein
MEGGQQANKQNGDIKSSMLIQPRLLIAGEGNGADPFS